MPCRVLRVYLNTTRRGTAATLARPLVTDRLAFKTEDAGQAAEKVEFWSRHHLLGVS